MPAKYKILFVDDEAGWCTRPIAKLEEKGFDVVYEEKAENALRSIKTSSPDIVLLDVMFGNENKGKPTFEEIKKKYPNLSVVILTSTMKDTFSIKDYPGCAFAYAKDQLNIGTDKVYAEFSEKISRVIEGSRTTVETTHQTFDFVVGETAAMKRVCEGIISVAPTNSSVLITGESGTGKELVAKAIHSKSARRHNAFVALNCGAIPKELMESELFGHEKGAFTGAINLKLGTFEVANGGTLFLDEVGDLPLSMQVKLLRVLQELEFTRVGGTGTIKTDVRILAATNKDLETEKKSGSFREDLYYRLNIFSIHLPSLRERKDDIPELLAYFIRKSNIQLGMNILIETVPGKRDYLRADLIDRLKNYNWPGNIRQLESEVFKAMINAGEYNVLLPEHFGSLQKTETNSHLDIDKVVNEVFEGKWKGKDAWDRFIKIYTKQGPLGEIMTKCIQRRKQELQRDLKHEDMAKLFSEKEDEILHLTGLMRKWITVELKIAWKKEKKFTNK